MVTSTAPSKSAGNYLGRLYVALLPGGLVNLLTLCDADFSTRLHNNDHPVLLSIIFHIGVVAL